MNYQNFDSSESSDSSEEVEALPIVIPTNNGAAAGTAPRSAPIFAEPSSGDKLVFSGSDVDDAVLEIHTTVPTSTTEGFHHHVFSAEGGADADDGSGDLARPHARAGRRLQSSAPVSEERAFGMEDSQKSSPKVRRFRAMDDDSSSSSDSDQQPAGPALRRAIPPDDATSSSSVSMDLPAKKPQPLLHVADAPPHVAAGRAPDSPSDSTDDEDDKHHPQLSSFSECSASRHVQAAIEEAERAATVTPLYGGPVSSAEIIGTATDDDAHMMTPQDTRTTLHASGTRSQLCGVDEADEEALKAFPLESEEMWTQRLSTQSAAIVSTSPLSQVYRMPAEEEEEEEDAEEEEDLVKVISLLHRANDSSRRQERQVLQKYVRRMAHDMWAMQQQLESSGLVPPGDQSTHRQGYACCGIRDIHVDASCRLVARLHVEPCSVTLRDVLAFQALPLTEIECIAVVKSITRHVAALHESNFIHGSLHCGNVMYSTGDGHCTLTQPMGIMSSSIIPTELAVLSPRRAAWLQPFVAKVWGAEGGGAVAHAGRLGQPQVVDPDEQLAWLVLELLSAKQTGNPLAQFGGYTPTPQDDVFAIGTIALSLLLGTPMFFGFTLHEAVETLCRGTGDGSRGTAMSALFFGLTGSRYAQRRFQQSGYSAKFIQSMEEFITYCLRSGADDGCEDAMTLLDHPLFVEYPINADEDASEEEDISSTDDTVHRVVYPVYVAMEHSRSQCGTTPYIARLHANSIFAARVSTLQNDVGGSGDDAAEADGTIAALWPLLDGRAKQWMPACPSVTSCQTASQRRSAVQTSAAHSHAWNFLVPKRLTHWGADDVPGDGERELLELQAECHVLPHLHTIVIEGRENAMLSLSREQLAPWRHVVDTLVLRDLVGCRVEILTHFRYVIVSNLKQCEVLLGPCYACLVQQTCDCAPIAVASSYLLMDDVLRVNFQFSGASHPTAAPGKEDGIVQVAMEPYGLVYPGLSEDFAAVGLPQEHQAALLLPDEEDVEGGGPNNSPAPLQRFVDLKGIDPQTHDFPYSHALAAFGNYFVHRDDNESDLYLYINELTGKDVRIVDIHGGSRRRELFSPMALSSVRDEGAAPHRSDEHYPVVFILDAVQDVVIRDCSHCTIFVAGATNSVVIERCHDMRVFFIAKECMVEDCNAVQLFALVTTYMGVTNCQYTDVWPLFLKCPYIDAIIKSVMNEAVEDPDDGPLVENAYMSNDIFLLNLVLQADGRSVSVTDCISTVVHDANWYHEERAQLIMISVPVPALEPAAGSEEEEEDGDEQQPKLSDCNFFEMCCESIQLDVMQDFQHVRFSDVIYRPSEDPSALIIADPQEGDRRILRLHDLLNVSILRTVGSFGIRDPKAIAAHREQSISGSVGDLVLERISMGTIHIAEAVDTLYIRNCMGPLDIAVCAARNVVMEGCMNVTVRTACCSFVAQDCHHCHLALHVNSMPRYCRCTGMLTSMLNITADRMEEMMQCVGVQMDVNLFSQPQVMDSTDSSTSHKPGRATTAAAGGVHAFCDGTLQWQGGSGDEELRVDSLADAFGILRRCVTIIPPLTTLAIGLEETAMPHQLAENVPAEESRLLVEDALAASLAFIAGADLLQAQEAAAQMDARAHMQNEGVTPSDGSLTEEASGAARPADLSGVHIDISEEAEEAAAHESAPTRSIPPPPPQRSPPSPPADDSSADSSTKEVQPATPHDGDDHSAPQLATATAGGELLSSPAAVARRAVPLQPPTPTPIKGEGADDVKEGDGDASSSTTTMSDDRPATTSIAEQKYEDSLSEGDMDAGPPSAPQEPSPLAPALVFTPSLPPEAEVAVDRYGQYNNTPSEGHVDTPADASPQQGGLSGSLGAGPRRASSSPSASSSSASSVAIGSAMEEAAAIIDSAVVEQQPPITELVDSCPDAAAVAPEERRSMIKPFSMDSSSSSSSPSSASAEQPLDRSSSSVEEEEAAAATDRDAAVYHEAGHTMPTEEEDEGAAEEEGEPISAHPDMKHYAEQGDADMESKSSSEAGAHTDEETAAHHPASAVPTSVHVDPCSSVAAYMSSMQLLSVKEIRDVLQSERSHYALHRLTAEKELSLEQRVEAAIAKVRRRSA